MLYAGADEDDDDHLACAEVLTQRAGELMVPVPVTVETAWLVGRRLGPEAEALFLRAVATELRYVDLLEDDWASTATGNLRP